MAEIVLKTHGLTRYFGALQAVDGLDLAVNRGEVFGLIGPNGSGKTTALNVISGFLPPTSGSVHYRGEEVTRLPPFQLARRGLVRTFQITSVFEGLSVFDNLLHASHLHSRGRVIGTLLKTRAYRDEGERLRNRIRDILSSVGLEARSSDMAGELSAGEHRYLEVAIALAAGPELLLLDEPAAGLNPEEAAQLGSLITSLRNDDVTVILVEHNMRMIMGVCSRVAVLNFGRKIAEGPPAAIREDPEVVTAYLGRRRGA